MEDDRETREALRQWVELFNAGRYFEAHEVLELPWLREVEPRKTLLKGLIHAAVALYHYGRGNGHGARVKYASCARYLEPYRPRCEGVDVEALLRDLEAFFAALLAQPRGAAPPPPTLPWPVASLEPPAPD